MENFSLLSISGPRMSSSTLSTFPDIMSSRATSLPDITKTALSTEASNPAQTLPPQYQSSILRHGVHNTVLSPENMCPREATKKFQHSPDSVDYITSQDILEACRWHPAQQSGFKCVACCRMYPTLHSLKSHIRGGFKEGFSCKVYYRKLKSLWGKEQKARPGDRFSSGSGQAFK
ncbi:spermatogenesis-associated protein 46 isoform X5 [Talpa occidentalis]|uniref:spermatogenesis-associated protein 46 isoform X5 n=1 Tax=Talpa occidentalis TaxID=50954 RepID=UPI0023F932B5|nr:spermatogenesis-associated protein 46 isoform X5 [Talpa occidentalis]